MPGYVQKALTRFQHPLPAKRQDQPYPHVKPNYGAKKQYSQEDDDSPALNKAGKKSFKRYAECSFSLQGRLMGDYSLPSALLRPSSQQANPTEKTMVLCKQFLDFMASQKDAVLTNRASDMVLAIHSDVSYLFEPKSRSRAGGHMFMAGKDEIPIDNGAVLNISQIIRAIMSSPTEAELGALFINAKTAVSMQKRLIELGHPQPRSPAPRCKPTMQQHMRYSPTKFYQKHSRPWTCASTGYGAVMPKANSVITGDLGRRTWQITSQSITQSQTTRVYALPY